MTIKQIVEGNDTLAGRLFDYVIRTLIFLSLLLFSLETLPGLDPELLELFDLMELITVVIFTVEYFLRILVADKKRGYILSFYGLVDLIAILPFYISSGIDLRSLRVFRFFRLLRALKLLQYSRAVKRLTTAFQEVKSEFFIFFVSALFVLYVSAVGIYYFENEAQPEVFASIFHSFWWAVATLSTVGYGDMYPITTGGRIFASFVVFTGLGVVAVPTGLIAAALSKTLREEKKES